MTYPSIRIEGAILSPDILDSLHDDTIGQRPADFGLDTGTKVKDEIVRAWADAQDYWRIYQRKLETLKPDSPATTETRNLWMVPLLGLLGYQLEYQPKAAELNGKFPIASSIALIPRCTSSAAVNQPVWIENRNVLILVRRACRRMVWCRNT